MSESSYALIGYPTGHSISPEIHARLFALSGVRADYRLMELAPEQLAATLPRLRTLNGFNVTIPHKQAILPLLDEVDGRAARYGAVNTVVCEDGYTIGYNTDVTGFLRALRQAGIVFAGRVLLCGTGGAAHMMACEALDRGCSLTVGARTYGKAAAFVEELLTLYPSASMEPSALAYVSGSFDLILNGTPCGMYPHTREMPVPLSVARSARAVFDAIYNPEETLLLARARAAGATVQNGLSMLVWQAAAAQEIWTKRSFAPEDIASLCKEMERYIKEHFTST